MNNTNTQPAPDCVTGQGQSNDVLMDGARWWIEHSEEGKQLAANARAEKESIGVRLANAQATVQQVQNNLATWHEIAKATAKELQDEQRAQQEQGWALGAAFDLSGGGSIVRALEGKAFLAAGTVELGTVLKLPAARTVEANVRLDWARARDLDYRLNTVLPLFGTFVKHADQMAQELGSSVLELPPACRAAHLELLRLADDIRDADADLTRVATESYKLLKSLSHSTE